MNYGGITFDTNIPILEGNWYDPKTGDTFTVRDSYMENDKYIVVTTDGRQISYDKLQRYVKSDKPITKQPKVDPIMKNKTLNSSISNEFKETKSNSSVIVGDLSKFDINTIDKNEIDELVSPRKENYINSDYSFKENKQVNTKSVNEDIIDRAIGSKLNDFELKIDFENLPIQEIDILKNIMKIDVDEISSYIIKKKLNSEDIKKFLSKAL